MQIKLAVARVFPPLRRVSAATPKEPGGPQPGGPQPAAAAVSAADVPAEIGRLVEKDAAISSAASSASTTPSAETSVRAAAPAAAVDSSARIAFGLRGTADAARAAVPMTVEAVAAAAAMVSRNGSAKEVTSPVPRRTARSMLQQLLPLGSVIEVSALQQLAVPLGQLLSRIRSGVELPSSGKSGSSSAAAAASSAKSRTQLSPSSAAPLTRTQSGGSAGSAGGRPGSSSTQSLEEAMREYNDGVLQFHGVPPPAAAAAAAAAATAAAAAAAAVTAATAVASSKEALSAAAGNQKARPAANTVAKQQLVMRVRQDVMLKAQTDGRMRALIASMRMKNVTTVSRAERVREFTKHLLAHPETRAIVLKEDVVPFLVSLINQDVAPLSTSDKELAGNVNEALSLLGYVRPPRGRGIRILSIDGGGTRGLIAIETLKWIEATCERPIHELFDYVCGVSTGGLLAVLVGAFRMPLSECERVYKECSERMFSSNAVLGASRLLLKYAYYDTRVWEDILKTEIGAEKTMLSTARDAASPKIAVVSCLTNQKCLKNFLFRNYNLPGNVASHYMGTANSRIWEAIRASSAAPGYFEEFKHGDYLHEDGGVLNNNPTAIAIHEAKHLWPGEALQCVVSLGNGRYEPSMDLVLPSGSSLMAKVTAIVQSATNTEGVHTVLLDLLDPAAYYRFNPYMSEEFGLDEIRPEKVRQMQFDADLYLRKNASKVRRVSARLLLPRRTHQVARDWLQERSMVLSYSLPSALPGASLLRSRRATAATKGGTGGVSSSDEASVM